MLPLWPQFINTPQRQSPLDKPPSIIRPDSLPSSKTALRQNLQETTGTSNSLSHFSVGNSLFPGAPLLALQTMRGQTRSEIFMKKFQPLTDGLYLPCLMKMQQTLQTCVQLKCHNKNWNNSCTWRECHSCLEVVQTKKKRRKCMTRKTVWGCPRPLPRQPSCPHCTWPSLISVAATVN